LGLLVNLVNLMNLMNLIEGSPPPLGGQLMSSSPVSEAALSSSELEAPGWMASSA
jgi:hypothetical protein